MRIYWVETDGPRELAIIPRPRGGDWLNDELVNLRREGIDIVVSLLTEEEQAELELNDEEQASSRAGLVYRHFAIPDREVPSDKPDFQRFVAEIQAALNSGKRVGAHCRAGIGRSSLLVAAVLCSRGMSSDEAFLRLSTARGLAVPDTPQQVEWVRSLTRSGSSFHK